MKKREETQSMINKRIGNKIGDKGAKAISESLKINTSLTALNLRSDEKTLIKKRDKMKRIKQTMNR